MHSEDIVTNLNDAQVVRIKSLIAQLKAEIAPFAVKRTPEERQALNSVDQGRRPFVDLAAEYTRDYHKELMIDADEVARTARINYDFDKLSEIETDLGSVYELVNDTTMQIGHNCYNTGLVVKDLVEIAIKRRKPGMEILWDNIIKLFVRGPKPKNGDAPGDGPTGPVDESPTA
jgi:hypothetical protein